MSTAQGILNYNRANTIAVSLWAADAGGANLNSLELQVTKKVESSMPKVVNQPLTAWAARQNVY